MSWRWKYSVPVLLLIAGFLIVMPGREERFVVFFSGAGMKVPAIEIAKGFKAATGIDVSVHFDGSSILRQHIEKYGDVDVFMSEDKADIDELINKGLVRESVFIAWHIPSILVPHEYKERIKGLNDLSKKGIRIVMSNPVHAASGRLVHEMLLRHPKGKEILKNVIAYGSSTDDSLRLFRDLYKNGGVDVLIEWDIMVNVVDGKGLIIVPFEKKYEIRDTLMLALIRKSGNSEISKFFYDYFKTEGIKVFKKYGYNTEIEK